MNYKKIRTSGLSLTQVIYRYVVYVAELRKAAKTAILLATNTAEIRARYVLNIKLNYDCIHRDIHTRIHTHTHK